MGRTPTGRPPGRQKGSGTLGLGIDDAHQRLTIRIPQDLYNRLEAYAEGRHYTRGSAQLAGCIRELVEHALVCPYKRQTVNRQSVQEYSFRQTVNSTHEAKNILEQTVNSTSVGEDGIRQTVNVPPQRHNVAPVAMASQPAAPVLDYDPTKYVLGKLCPRGHDYQNTGRSLLSVKNKACKACKDADTQKRRAAKRQARSAGSVT